MTPFGLPRLRSVQTAQGKSLGTSRSVQIRNYESLTAPGFIGLHLLQNFRELVLGTGFSSYPL